MTFTDTATLNAILQGKPQQKHYVKFEIGLQAGSLDSENRWCAQFPGTVKVDISIDQLHQMTADVGTELQHIEINFEDQPTLSQGKLVFELSGLEPYHTLDVNPMLKLCYLKLDQLNLIPLLETNGEYQVASETQIPGEFYGCNGRVELNFETPLYQWLLDNKL
jgi:hypothetical protein